MLLAENNGNGKPLSPSRYMHLRFYAANRNRFLGCTTPAAGNGRLHMPINTPHLAWHKHGHLSVYGSANES